MTRKQILVVEGNELNRGILCQMLSNTYAVLEAENGQVALDILRQSQDSIALVLLDVVMPVMDGYTFLDIIRKDAVLSLIPVIVMTQENSEDDEIAALEHGANDFVPKPYRMNIIKHRIAALIKLRETAAMVNQFKYDRLTGLYTKEYFYLEARACLDEHPEREYTILCCNLENFRLYNDTFGREAGDQLLVEEAILFRQRVSPDAICCRYNADRFLCLTEKESEKIGRKRFVASRESGHFELKEKIPVKLGVYEIRDRSISVEQMCDWALWAVDTIKGKYDQHVAVYDDFLRSKLLREQALTDAMEVALAEKQFLVYFQPKYSLNDETMVGAEALVRWMHPQWGFLSPGEFIPLFERNGFIHRLDAYVWRGVCEKLRQWKESGYPLVPVSVNISRTDIYQLNLVDTLCGLVKEYDIDPALLHLEITESAYTENPNQLIMAVSQLRRHGFVIEMDDFGSGYSSLNMLGQMSLDILKLDMQFVQNEMIKHREQSLLGDVIRMAHRMHLRVLAEGVETREQRQRLKEMGCDYAQGYFFSKPLPAGEFEVLLKVLEVQSLPDLLPQETAQRGLLIVDENATYRQQVSTYFEGMYQIFEASDAESALACVTQYGSNLISAILLSESIANDGATTFLNKMRQSQKFRKIPIIATTSCLHRDAHDVLDTDTVLCKFYPLDELYKQIERLTNIASFDERENSLRREAKRDHLTGLLNRRGLQAEMVSLSRDEYPLAVCLFDMDDFKKANDTFGHNIGDRLLSAFAEILRQKTRKTDIRCRYGGDEFLVVFKNVHNEDNAIKKAMEICNLYHRLLQTENLPAACSCGIAMCTTDDVPGAILIERADEALYRAKRENKGGYCLWE